MITFKSYLAESKTDVTVGDIIDKLKEPSLLDLQYDTVLKNFNITSLVGCPESAITLNATATQLKNLEGIPKKIDNDCFLCQLKIDNFNGAEDISVGGLLSFSYCQFKSLHDIHKAIKSAQELSFIGNPVESHVLGVLKIQNLEKILFLTRSRYDDVIDTLKNDDAEISVMLAKAQQILNKYLPNTGGNAWIMRCQTELIEAGLRDFAKL